MTENSIQYVLEHFLAIIMSIPYSFVKVFYPLFKDFIYYSSEFFEGFGQDFLSLFFDDIDTSKLMSVNIVYWVVGASIVFYLFKNFMWPLFIATYNAITDLITPL